MQDDVTEATLGHVFVASVTQEPAAKQRFAGADVSVTQHGPA